MPLYKAKAYLSHTTGIVQTGQTLELTEEQAERLGDEKVERVTEDTDFTDAPLTEDVFRALSAEKQKEIVADLDGDLNELTNADKRWAYVADNQ